MAIYELEPRVLFDGAAAVATAEAVVAEMQTSDTNVADSADSNSGDADSQNSSSDTQTPNPDSSTPATDSSQPSTYSSTDQTQIFIDTIIGTYDATTDGENILATPDNSELLSTDSGSSDLQSSHEVVFIDALVKDADTIVASLDQNAEVVYLDSSESGIAQITDYLSTHEDISSVQIVSEGNYAQIMLGDDVITADNIENYKDAISSWQSHLTADADILFYGCDIAKDSAGQGVLNDIAQWAGADVAASTDTTGIQGDWDLEYTTGVIEAHSITLHNYGHNLETYTVTAITDDGTGADHTLSWAINSSNATTTVDDTIAFNLDSGDTVTISAALPTITDSVTIDGTNIATGNDVTVQVTTPGSSNFRVFNINASGETVTIENMTVMGGDMSGQSTANAYGGSIYIASGTVNIDHMTVSGSKAKFGGGIYSDTGTFLNIDSSSISDNSASGNGGGISSNGTLTITSSTISNNIVGTGGIGGGICPGDGGLTIIDSTICGNTAGIGGGISANFCGTITIISSTISENTSSSGGGGIDSMDANIYLLNTVIVHNTGSGGDDIRVYGSTIVYSYYSWYHDVSGTINTQQSSAPNVTTAYTAGNLGPLQDNGGPTYTMALSSSAPAAGTGTSVYYNAANGYYFVDNTGTSHQLTNWDNHPTVVASDKITTDQRGVTITTPSMGAYTLSYYYRTNLAGTWNWSTAANWQLSTDNSTWATAAEAPDAENSIGITILSGANVTVDSSITIDQTTINSGGQITISSGQTLTIADGTETTDLTNNGTLTVDGTLTNSGQLGNASDLDINTNDSLGSGTLTNTGTIYASASAVTLPAALIGGTVIYDGTAAQAVYNATGTSYTTLQISTTGGNTTSSGTLTTGTLIVSGTSTLNAVNLTVNTTFTNSGITQASGTVSLPAATVGGTFVYTGTSGQTIDTTGTSYTTLQISTTGGNATSSGTLTASSLTVGSTSTLDAESLAISTTFTNSGTTQASGTVSLPAATIGGTFVYDGTSGQTVDTTGTSYTTLQISTTGGNATSSGTLTASSLTVGSTSTLDAESLAISTTFTNSGTTQASGTVSLPDAAVSGTFIYDGASQTIDNLGGNAYAILNLAGTGTITIDSGTTNATAFTVTGTYTSNTITNNGALSLGGSADFGSITAINGTVVFAGTAQTLSSSSGTAFNNLTISSSTSTTLSASTVVTVNGTFTLNSQIVLDTGAQLTLNGSTTGSGTVNAPYEVVSFDSDSINGSQNIFGGTYGGITTGGTGVKSLIGNVTIGTSGLTVGGSSTFAVNSYTATVAGATTIASTLTISTGTFSANGAFDATNGAVTFTGAGNLNLSSTVTSLGTFTEGTSTVTYDGANQTVDSDTYYNLVLSGSETITIDSGTTYVNTALSVTGSYSSNTITNNGTLSLAGSASFGSVTTIGGTVVYDGDSQTIGSLTYSNLILSGSGDKTASSGITVSGTFENTRSLTLSSGNFTVTGTSTIGADITSTAAGTQLQTYTGAVTLSTDVELSSYVIYFNSTINGTSSGTEGLTVNTSASAYFEGAIGTTPGNELEYLTVSTTQTHIYADITTTLTQTYSGAVKLENNVALTGTTVIFNSTLNSQTSQSLAITGDAQFNAAVGHIRALSALSVTGASSIGANITTSGAQTYTGAVTLTGNSVLATTNSAISLAGGVSGSYNLSTASGTSTTTLGSGKSINMGSGVLTNTSGSFVTNGGNITVGGLTVTAGTFNSASSDGTWDINGNVEIGNGATLNSTSDTFTVSGNWSGSGTFAANGSTVTFDGSSDQTISGSNTFYNLTIANTGDPSSIEVDASNSTSLAVTNNLYVSDGKFISATDYNNVLIASGAVLELSGDITVSGTWVNNGTFTPATYTVTFDGSDQEISGTFYNLTASGSGIKTLCGNLTITNNLTVESNITLAVGTYTASVTGTSDINGTLTISTGTYNANGAFDASSGGTVTFSDTGSLNLADTVTSLGTFTADSSTVTYSGAGQTVDDVIYSTLNLTGSGVVVITDGVDVNTAFTVGGTVSALTNSGTLTLGGSADFGSTVTSIGGTVIYDGTSQTVDNITYNNLSLTGSGTVTITSGTDVNTALTVGSSVSALANSGTLTLGGSANFGSVTSIGGTVVYDGASQTVDNLTYSTLNLTGSGTDVITDGTDVNTAFTVGGSVSALTNSGTLTLGGSANFGSVTSIGGIVVYDGTSQTVDNITYNNLSLTGSGTVTITDGVDANTSLTLGSGITALDNSGTLTLGGSANFGSVTSIGGTVIYDGTSQTVNNISYNNLSLTGSGTDVITSGVDVNGAFTVGGTVSALTNSGTLTLGGSANFGSVTSIGGIVVYDGASQTVDNITYSTLNLTGSGTDVITSGTDVNTAFTVGGTVSALTNSGTLTLGGSANFGSVTSIGGTVVYDGASQTVDNITYSTLNLTGSGTDVITDGTDVNTAFTVGGTVSALTNSGTLTLGGSADFGSTLTSIGGIVVYDGTSQTIDNITYNNLDLSGTGAKTLSGDLNINNDFTAESTVTVQGAYSLTVSNNAYISGAIGSATALTTISISGTTDIGADITTTGAQNYTQTITLTNDITVKSGSGVITFTGEVQGSYTLDIGNTTQTGAIFFIAGTEITGLQTHSGAYSVSLSGSNSINDAVTFSNTNGVVLGTASTDSFTFTSGVTSIVSVTSIAGTITAPDGNTIQFETTNVTSDASIGCNIILGDVTIADGQTLTLGDGDSGNITVSSISGTSGGASSDVVINTLGVLTLDAVDTGIGNLSITIGSTSSLTNDIDISGTLTKGGTGELQIQSDDFASGGITLSGGTLSGGSYAWTVSGDIVIGSNTTLNAPKTLNVTGNWDNDNGGTFNHNNGRVCFQGENTTSYIYGANTFYEFDCYNIANKTLVFDSTQLQTVESWFWIMGTDHMTNTVKLQDLYIDTYDYSVAFAKITNSTVYGYNDTPAEIIIMSYSTVDDYSEAHGWYAEEFYEWDGGGGDGDWNNAANWTSPHGGIPSTDSDILINTQASQTTLNISSPVIVEDFVVLGGKTINFSDNNGSITCNYVTGQGSLGFVNQGIITSDAGINITIISTGADVATLHTGTMTPGAGGSIALASPVITVSHNLITTGAGISLTGTTVNIWNDLTISTSGGNLTINGVITANTANSSNTLVLNAGTGSVYLYGFSNTNRIESLEVTAGPNSTHLNDNVYTEGTQTYTGHVVIDADVILDSDDNDISFSDTVDADANTSNRTLTLDSGTGNITFSDTIGAAQAIDTLTITNAGTVSLYDVTTRDGGVIFTNTPSGVITLNGNISTNDESTAGAVAIKGTVVLATDIVINTDSTTDGAISFTGTIDGTLDNTQSLTLNAGSTGAISVTGAIGGTTNIRTLTVTNSNSATFSGAVTADTSVVLSNTTGTITFNGALVTPTLSTTSNAYNVTLNGHCTITNPANFLNTGTTTIGNDASDSSTFTGGLTATAGAVNIAGTIITIDNNINLGAVTQIGASTLKSGTGSITVASMTGDYDLTLQSNVAGATGAVTFTGNVAVNDIITFAQNYAVTLQGSTNVIDSDTSFLNTGTTTIGNDASDSSTFTGGLDVTAGAVHIAGTVATTDTNMDLGAVTQTGASTLKSGTGSITVASMTGDYDLTLQSNVAGATGAVTFTGNVTVNDIITFAQNYAVTLQGSTNVIDSDTSFLNTGTTTIGNNASDSSTFTGGLDATAGSVHIAGTVATTDTNMDLGAVTQTGASTLKSGTGSITVASMTGDYDLTLQSNIAGATGAVTFTGNVTVNDIITFAQNYAVTLQGSTNVIDSDTSFLNTGTTTIGNDASDSSTFTGGLDATAGAVNIAGIVATSNANIDFSTVTLTKDAELSGSTVTFNSTLDAAASGQQGLIVTGNAVFGNAVGATPLKYLTVNGTSNIAGGTYTTGNQTYNGAVTIGGNFQMIANDGTNASTITFSDTVNGSYDLWIGFGGFETNAVVNGAIGGSSALTLFYVTGTSSVGANITTSGAQGYSGEFTLTDNAVLNTPDTITFSNAVTINNGKTLTVGTGNTGAITFGGTVDSAIGGTGNLTINTDDTVVFSDNAGETAALGAITLISGSLTAGVHDIHAGTFSVDGGTFGATASSGIWDAGNVGIANGATMNATTGAFTVGGNWANSGTFNHMSGTVTFDGTSGQTIAGSTEFYNLTIANTSSSEKVDASASTGFAVTNLLSISDGIFVTPSAADFNNVTITSNGALELSGDITVSGNWSNTGTLTANSNTVTFDGNSTQTLSGSNIFYNLTIANTGNPSSVEVDASSSTSLAVTNNLLVSDGKFISATDYHNVTITSAGILELSGDITVSGNWSNTGTFTPYNHAVTLDGADQTISAETFYSLASNGTGLKTLTGNVTIENALTLASGIFVLGSYNMTLQFTGAINGTGSSTSMIASSGSGSLIKRISGNGTYAFPVGSLNGSAGEYSPITIELTSGTYSTAYLSIQVVHEKEPHVTATSFLNRYWVVTSSGISNFTADITCQYLRGDVDGVELGLNGELYSGTSWTQLGPVSTSTHTFSGSVTSFGNFTAFSNADRVPSINDATILSIIADSTAEPSNSSSHPTYNFGVVTLNEIVITGTVTQSLEDSTSTNFAKENVFNPDTDNVYQTDVRKPLDYDKTSVRDARYDDDSTTEGNSDEQEGYETAMIFDKTDDYLAMIAGITDGESLYSITLDKHALFKTSTDLYLDVIASSSQV